MGLEKIKELIEENKDNDEVKTYLQGLNPITVEGINSFITQNDDAQKWFDSEKDKHYNKAFDTWKSNNLEKLIDEQIKVRFPEKDEKDIELEKVKVELEKIKADATKKELTNKALLISDEKQLPKQIIKFFIGADEETTIKNLEALESVFSSHVEKLVQERLKDNSYTPPGGGSDDVDISKMSMEEYAEYYKKRNKK